MNKKFAKDKIINMLKSKSFIFALSMYLITLFINQEVFIVSVKSSIHQIGQAMTIIPVIFILIGLIDVWIDRDMMVKYMGEESGIKGILIAFIFGTLAAGPLVGAFPLAYVMLKKGARYANVLFFLSIWSSAKLPIMIFQTQAMGLKYTMVTNATLITVFLFGSYMIEKILGNSQIENMREKAESYI